MIELFNKELKHTLNQKFSNENIQIAEKEISQQIYEKYKDKNPIFLIVLKGGMTFACDLFKYFPFDFKYRIRTVSASSYKSETSPVEKVDIYFVDHPKCDWAKDEYIVIIDDVADTFNTLYEIKNHILLKNAKQIETCVLLEKPFRRELSEIPDYYGLSFVYPGFLVGYGMGYDDLYRHLPDIYQLEIPQTKI